MAGHMGVVKDQPSSPLATYMHLLAVTEITEYQSGLIRIQDLWQSLWTDISLFILRPSFMEVVAKPRETFKRSGRLIV